MSEDELALALAELRAAHAVIRRYQAGWRPWGKRWVSGMGTAVAESEPMTDQEWAVIQRAKAGVAFP